MKGFILAVAVTSVALTGCTTAPPAPSLADQNLATAQREYAECVRTQGPTPLCQQWAAMVGVLTEAAAKAQTARANADAVRYQNGVAAMGNLGAQMYAAGAPAYSAPAPMAVTTCTRTGPFVNCF